MTELNANTQHRWSLIYRLRDGVTASCVLNAIVDCTRHAEGIAAILNTQDAQDMNDDLRGNAAEALADKMGELRALVEVLFEMQKTEAKHA
jgi:hypothetical protein